MVGPIYIDNVLLSDDTFECFATENENVVFYDVWYSNSSMSTSFWDKKSAIKEANDVVYGASVSKVTVKDGYYVSSVEVFDTQKQ